MKYFLTKRVNQLDDGGDGPTACTLQLDRNPKPCFQLNKYMFSRNL